jgi:hypothetical protein
MKGSLFIDFVSTEALRKGLLEKLTLFIEAEVPKTDISGMTVLYISVNPYAGRIMAKFDTPKPGMLEKVDVTEFLKNEGVKVTGYKVFYLTPSP